MLHKFKNMIANVTLIPLLTISLCLASQEIINANNLFTASIYKELLKENQENFLVSPFSIETALSFVQEGAKDETGKEIRSALKLPEDQNKIKEAFKSLTESLENTGSYSLHSANKMYVKNGASIKEDFKKVAKEIYKAGSENVNFGNPEEASQIINKWVEEQTQEKIKDLVEPNKIHPLTVAILVNALYFKGNYTKPFGSLDSDIKLKFFGPGPEDVGRTEVMTGTDTYGYYEDTELKMKMLKIDFEGGDASLVIILPDEITGLSALEKNVDKIFSVNNFTDLKVEVTLPKFKIESKFLLNTFLKNLGMKLAFSDGADLSGIAGDPGDIFINNVIQKTFIDVNEVGVEAAAASYADVVDKIAGERSKVFNANHSFMFYLKIKGIIMFVGRFVKP